MAMLANFSVASGVPQHTSPETAPIPNDEPPVVRPSAARVVDADARRGPDACAQIMSAAGTGNTIVYALAPANPACTLDDGYGGGLQLPPNTVLHLGEFTLVVQSAMTLSYGDSIEGSQKGDVRGPFESRPGAFAGGTTIQTGASFPSGGECSSHPASCALVSYVGGADVTEANVRVQDVYLLGEYDGATRASYGFYADKFSGIALYRVAINKVLRDAFHFASSGAHVSYWVSASDLYANGELGDAFYSEAHQVRCIRCASDNGSHSIHITNGAQENRFIDGHFESAIRNAVLIDGWAGVGNEVSDSTIICSPGAMVCVDIASTQAPVLIRGNTVSGQDAKGTFGIQAKADQVLIQGNAIGGFATGIQARFGSGDSVIGNTVRASRLGLDVSSSSNGAWLGNTVTVSSGGTCASGGAVGTANAIDDNTCSEPR